MIRDAATQRQVDAADPTRSTWLSANAGSGKTRVLTDRVARLLLDGVPPDHILCLTYTKAAASEMQNRLFKRLGDWAMLDDGALRSALTDLGAEAGSSERLAKARRLFASAIETPGGLRIQTIHSFCSGLLRRFPLEAGVSPQFTEIEDRAAERLRAEILDQIATGSDSQVLDDVATVVSDLTFEDLAARVVGARGAFAAQGPTDSMTEGVIRAAYDLPDGLTPDALVSQLLGAADLDVLAAVRPILAASGANDQKAAAKLAQVTPDLAGVMMLETVVLSGPKAKIPLAAKVGSLPTKALVNTGKMDAWLPAWDDLMRRVEKARPLRLGLMAADRDMRLHRFATAFLPRYERAKQQRGWLDFDDLITRTEALLRDPVVAQWVLFRLDGAIDHILVDEAQDTSPTQWSVIARLAHEFTTGEGARADVLRTIFVVGDKKQSIYSFQGADAAEFDRMQADFADRLAGVGATLQTTSLAFSFRSAAEVLSVVDATFEGRAGSGFDGEPHAAFKTALPGRVDLWPVVPRAEAPDDTDWRAPVDHISPEHHTVRLARRIAQTVARMMADGTRLPLGDGASRPVTAGDVLILVRRRSALFGEIIRACKACGLPMAGADRFKVMAELAVRDIIAVLRFIDTAEDDLSLATALRSPLFGLDEQALFDLAHRRPAGASLWETLRGQADAFRPVLDVLDDLRGQADFLRPYDLIERLLIRHAGRARLVGRLGAEAEDGIDALLGQALAYEQTEIPTLTGFLQWAQSDALEIKRETASGEGKLRVMTVHGSKGLEAPIVILPDCTKPSTPRAGALAADERGVMWPLAQADQPPRQQARAQQAQQAAAAEWDRLLYVAMTRAETWLMVAAVDDLGKDGRDWYSQVRQGMERVGATAHMFDFGEASGVPDRGEGLRFEG
ncbi:MAG: double-strand break repair helicase AddA, partial [Paracoccaceae bacterium]